MSLSIFPKLSEEQEVIDSIQFTLYTPNVNPATQAGFAIEIVNQSQGDFLDQIVNFGEASSNVLNGMYEYSNNTYYCDIEVSKTVIENEIPIKTVANIELISYIGNVGYTASRVNDTTIRIYGKPLTVFTEQIFTVLMEDLKTLKNVQANTNEKYAALVKWQPPSIKEKTISHTLLLRVSYEETAGSKTAIQTFSLPQKVRWRLDLGVNAFNNFLSKGSI